MQRQKRYRELIPMTYQQYLDEPDDVIEWTLRIDQLEQDVKAQQKQQPTGGPGNGRPRTG